MSEPARVEYRVKPVTRYIVTRFVDGRPNGPSAVGGRGEYDNADTAYEVGYALAKAEHERLGWPAFDDRMQYPRHPNEPTAIEVSA